MYGSVIEPYSLIWWKMNISILFIGTVLFILGFWISEKIREKCLKYVGVFLLFDLFFFEFALYYMGSWNIHWALPLQYCTMMEFCAALVLITRWQGLYEVLLFLGIIGPLQALIAPALPYTGNYFFYEFYISHSVPILVPIFLTLIEKMRPRKGAWWKTICKFILFATVIFFFDYVTGSNYMYLMEKPPLEHPFLNVGVWPVYLILWLGVLIGWSFLVHQVVCPSSTSVLLFFSSMRFFSFHFPCRKRKKTIPNVTEE